MLASKKGCWSVYGEQWSGRWVLEPGLASEFETISSFNTAEREYGDKSKNLCYPIMRCGAVGLR